MKTPKQCSWEGLRGQQVIYTTTSCHWRSCKGFNKPWIIFSCNLSVLDYQVFSLLRVLEYLFLSFCLRSISVSLLHVLWVLTTLSDSIMDIELSLCCSVEGIAVSLSVSLLRALEHLFLSLCWGHCSISFCLSVEGLRASLSVSLLRALEYLFLSLCWGPWSISFCLSVWDLFLFLFYGHLKIFLTLLWAPYLLEIYFCLSSMGLEISFCLCCLPWYIFLNFCLRSLSVSLLWAFRSLADSPL